MKRNDKYIQKSMSALSTPRQDLDLLPLRGSFDKFRNPSHKPPMGSLKPLDEATRKKLRFPFDVFTAGSVLRRKANAPKQHPNSSQPKKHVPIIRDPISEFDGTDSAFNSAKSMGKECAGFLPHIQSLKKLMIPPLVPLSTAAMDSRGSYCSAQIANLAMLVNSKRKGSVGWDCGSAPAQEKAMLSRRIKLRPLARDILARHSNSWHCSPVNESKHSEGKDLLGVTGHFGGAVGGEGTGSKFKFEFETLGEKRHEFPSKSQLQQKNNSEEETELSFGCEAPSVPIEGGEKRFDSLGRRCNAEGL